MSYKSLIVSITDAETDRGAVNQAAALAARHDAHLTALHIYEPPYYRYPLAYIDMSDIDPEAARGQDKHTLAVCQAFEDACRAPKA